jgi:hypothetical protein
MRSAPHDFFWAILEGLVLKKSGVVVDLRLPKVPAEQEVQKVRLNFWR